ncbi:MAG: peptidase domain-containing ABC transporter [Methylococcales bacterium]
MNMKLILQSEAAECGLACLSMISDAHGLHVDLADLRRRFSVSLKGATLSSLIRHAEALEFSARPVRLELSELDELRLPCILHWNLNHFVVLKAVKGKQVVLLDPASGERRMAMDEVSDHFTGVALELEPTAQFKSADERKPIRLRELTGRILGLRRTLVQVFLLALALEIFAIASPLFNQFVVDEVVLTADRELLAVLVVGFGLLLVIQTSIGVLRSWILMRLAIDVRLQWTGSLFAHMLRLPAAFFEKRHLGDIVSRFGSINALQGTLTTAIVSAVLDGIMAIMALGMMLVYSAQLTGIVIVSILVYGALRWAFYRPFRDASQERLVLSARENSHFLETLRAVVPIKLAGFESERRARWQNLLIDVFNRDVKTQKLGILFTTASTFITGASSLIFFSLGAKQVMDNTLTLGMLMAFTSYAGTFSGRVNALISYGIDLKMLGMHAERVADIALEAPEVIPAIETDVSRLIPSIEVRNLSFRYADGEPWVLKDLNLSIEAGESVAIIGPSGCGKTTLLKVLLGLLTPTEGDVLLDGIPVKRLGLNAYRSLIGAVLQEDSLMAGSIAENITFFDSGANQEQIEGCAQIAAIHEEIHRMPMGYQTLVGDMGSTLSGGQKQRVLLARALYRNPKILILDEATSHLDIFNEHRIVKTLAELKLTRIVVAHRQETIDGAERVIALMPDASAHRISAGTPVEPTTTFPA